MPMTGEHVQCRARIGPVPEHIARRSEGADPCAELRKGVHGRQAEGKHRRAEHRAALWLGKAIALAENCSSQAIAREESYTRREAGVALERVKCAVFAFNEIEGHGASEVVASDERADPRFHAGVRHRNEAIAGAERKPEARLIADEGNESSAPRDGLAADLSAWA